MLTNLQIYQIKNNSHFQAVGAQPGDFKRKKYFRTNSNITSRVLNPNLQEKKPTRFYRSMSTSNIKNDGNWNNLILRTSLENRIIGNKTRISNPNTYKSTIFENYNYDNKKYRKITPFSEYLYKTQIYSLPGGIKRNKYKIKDDVKNFNIFNYAHIRKLDKDFNPVNIKKDYPYENKNLFMGGYGNKNKLKSNVFNNLATMTHYNNKRSYKNLYGNNNYVPNYIKDHIVLS